MIFLYQWLSAVDNISENVDTGGKEIYVLIAYKIFSTISIQGFVCRNSFKIHYKNLITVY